VPPIELEIEDLVFVELMVSDGERELAFSIAGHGIYLVPGKETIQLREQD
jgi:hypothetical protein